MSNRIKRGSFAAFKAADSGETPALIKNGLSWPAAFFGPIWAWRVGLKLRAVALLPGHGLALVMLYLLIVGGGLEPVFAGLFCLASPAWFLWVARRGNAWLRQAAVKRGAVQVAADVQADTRAQAIAELAGQVPSASRRLVSDPEWSDLSAIGACVLCLLSATAAVHAYEAPEQVAVTNVFMVDGQLQAHTIDTMDGLERHLATMSELGEPGTTADGERVGAAGIFSGSDSFRARNQALAADIAAAKEQRLIGLVVSIAALLGALLLGRGLIGAAFASLSDALRFSTASKAESAS